MMALMKLVLGLRWSFLVPRWNMCQGFPAAKRLAFHLLLPPSTPITTSITMLIKSSLLCCKVCHCKTLCKSATILTCIHYLYTNAMFDLHKDVCPFKPENIHTHIIHDRLMIDDVCHCIIYALLDVSFYQICTMMCAIVKHYTYNSVRFAQ